MKTQRDVYKMIAKVCNVDFEQYLKLVEDRGMKSSKALVRLGASQKLVALVANLKLATSVEEINAVYADTTIKSCLTGHKPGQFFKANGINVLHSADFRVLVGTKAGICHKAYGTRGQAILKLIFPYFDSKYQGPAQDFCTEMVEYYYPHPNLWCGKRPGTVYYEEDSSIFSLDLPKEALEVVYDQLKEVGVGTLILHPEDDTPLGFASWGPLDAKRYRVVEEEVYTPVLYFSSDFECTPYLDFPHRSTYQRDGSRYASMLSDLSRDDLFKDFLL